MEIKKIIPTFNRIMVTMDAYDSDPGGLIWKPSEMKGEIKPVQRVMAVGDTVRGITPGQMVHLNLVRYGVYKHQEGTMRDGVITDNPVVDYNVPTVNVGGKTYMLIYDQDVDYIITEYTEDED